MKFSQESLKLLTHMLDCPSVEENKVEYFRALTDIFLPLCESASSGFRLCAQILEKTQEPSIFDICCFCFDQAFHFLEVVVYLMRLLHVIFV